MGPQENEANYYGATAGNLQQAGFAPAAQARTSGGLLSDVIAQNGETSAVIRRMGAKLADLHVRLYGAPPPMKGNDPGAQRPAPPPVQAEILVMTAQSLEHDARIVEDLIDGLISRL